MNGIYLLLGSNIGDRLGYLKQASKMLTNHGTHILDESSIYETQPWGESDQPWFLNLVLKVETKLTPEGLLQACLKIEHELGRERIKKWAERVIDIDILYFNDELLDSSNLNLPHPEIPNRRFTLVPLVELAALEVHPSLNKTQLALLSECTDMLECHITELKI